jgi:hypothetical protein
VESTTRPGDRKLDLFLERMHLRNHTLWKEKLGARK